METYVYNPQDIAALWFTGFFVGLMFYYVAKSVWNMGRTGRANYPDGSQEQYDNEELPLEPRSTGRNIERAKG